MTAPKSPRTESKARVLLVLSFIGFLGIAILAAGLLIDQPDAQLKELTKGFLHLLGTTLFVAVCLSVIHEFYLNTAAMQDIKLAVKEVTTEVNEAYSTSIQRSIKTEIRNAMPPKYINIKQVGIVDAYTSMQMDKWSQRIQEARNANVRILKIWIDDFYVLETALYDAVSKRECNVQIMLLDPSSSEAIKKRATSLHRLNPNYIEQAINQNLRTLYSLWDRLPAEKKPKFQVKLHQSFVAVSLHGLEDEFVFGLYLHGRLAPQGTQIKVHGANHPLYRELDEHFEEEWKLATSFDFEAYGQANATLPPVSYPQQQPPNPEASSSHSKDGRLTA